MKRDHFKEITENHLAVAKEIIDNGHCRTIPCSYCPLSCDNLIDPPILKDLYCVPNNFEVTIAALIALINLFDIKSLEEDEKCTKL